MMHAVSGCVQRSRGTSNSDLGEDWDKAIENVKASVPSILHYSCAGLEGKTFSQS
jgi:hypothetical protein